MPKKSVMDKKEEAKEREATKKSEKQQKAAKDAEDAYWREAGEGSSKADKRKEEEERRKAEQAAKKAELKRLQEQEEAELASAKAKAKLTPAGAQKVTKYQLDQQRELEEQLKEEQQRERSLAQKREVDEGTYTRLIAMENTNRVGEGVVDASGVDHALAALTVGEGAAEDKHPEKRLKAAYKAFEERMLVEIKQEKPGMKMSQYREQIWKLWAKSPDNPINQAARA